MVEARVTLPPAPLGLEACLRAPSPEIPDRDLTQSDVVGLLARFRVLDKAKTRCGLRGLSWIQAVRADFAK